MARPLGNLWIPSDPPGPSPIRAVPALFDERPERNVGRPGIELAPELLNEVIATCLELGCPRAMAEQARFNRYRRVELATVWALVQDAAEGDASAVAALDRIRTAWQNSDHVGEILAASEQPADGGELRRELGLD